jgi:hypothetical protein
VRGLFPHESEGPWSDTAGFGTSPDVAAEEEAVVAEGEAPDTGPDAPSPENSPVAAGPAQDARTSQGMALTFIAVLLVSFMVTILLVMLFL